MSEEIKNQAPAEEQKPAMSEAQAILAADPAAAAADAEAAKIRADGVKEAAQIKAQTETDVAKIYAQAQSANIELYKFLKDLDTIVASVNESSVLVVKADEYPFNVLTKYSKYMTNEGNNIVIQDLNYILTQLPDKDREALVGAVSDLLGEL